MTETVELSRSSTGASDRPLRIATLGWHGAGNLGNDGCLEAMIHFIRREFPRAEITAICPGPDEIRKKFGVGAIQMRWEPGPRWMRGINKLALKTPSAVFNWVNTSRHIGVFDALVVPGAGLIDDYRTNFLGRPAVLRRWCAAAKRNGVPIVFASVGADPIRNALSRWMVKPVVPMATYRSYRDEGSRDYMQSIGVDERATPVCPDLAWGLPSPPTSSRSDARMTVGVGVMAYHGWRSIEAGRDIHDPYVDKVTEFVDWLADSGYRVRLLIGEKSDQRVVNAVAAKARCVATDAWIAPTPAASLHELMAQIADVDVVVASRFHNVLCALKMGRPTISLAYMPKCNELLEQAGTPGLCQMIEEFDVEKLKAQFTELVADRERLEGIIRQHVRQLEVKLGEQEVVLARLLQTAGAQRD